MFVKNVLDFRDPFRLENIVITQILEKIEEMFLALSLVNYPGQILHK